MRLTQEYASPRFVNATRSLPGQGQIRSFDTSGQVLEVNGQATAERVDAVQVNFASGASVRAEGGQLSVSDPRGKSVTPFWRRKPAGTVEPLFKHPINLNGPGQTEVSGVQINTNDMSQETDGHRVRLWARNPHLDQGLLTVIEMTPNGQLMAGVAQPTAFYGVPEPVAELPVRADKNKLVVSFPWGDQKLEPPVPFPYLLTEG